MTSAAIDTSYIAALEARIVALESRAPEGLMSSKTLRFLLVLLGIAFAAIVLAAIGQRFFAIQTPYLSDFINLIGLNGGVGTARNVTADHVMPAMQSWKTAQAQAPTQPPATPGF